MIKFPFIALFALLFLKFVSRKQTKTFLISLISPLSIFAQNGESGGGSSGEILFYLFVLGFLVSILPKRETKFEQKAMRVIKVWILLSIIPQVARAQTAAILRGDVLPDFTAAKVWDNNRRLDGDNTAICYLPLLKACDIGDYKVQFYFYSSDTLYKYGFAIQMMCWENMKEIRDVIDIETQKRFSESYHAIGNGRWYGVITEGEKIGCGYVFSYQVQNNSYAWRKDKLGCN